MSGVQVRGNIKARADGKFDDRLATNIGERLIALEKANRGTGDSFVTPELPSFGSGSPTGAPGAPGPPGAPGAPGATDHGALTGLEDDDHPQYVQHLERVPPSPHVHTAEELGFDSRFYRRGEGVPAIAHVHSHQTIVGIGSGDDHPQYQLRSEKDLAGGYPGMVQIGGVVFTLQTSLSSAGVGTFLKRNAGAGSTPVWTELVGQDVCQAAVVLAMRVFGG